jgi:hypothetical protein
MAHVPNGMKCSITALVHWCSPRGRCRELSSRTISCMRSELLTYAERGSPMTATLTHVVKQVPQDWTSQLAPDAILTACRGLA